MTKRISISMEDKLEEWVRQRAQEQDRTISNIVTRALKDVQKEERRIKTIRALEDDARLNHAMAENNWKEVEELERG